jgi:hypothetical protein
VYIATIKLNEVKTFLVRLLHYSPDPGTSVNAGDLHRLKKRYFAFLQNDAKGLSGHAPRNA